MEREEIAEALAAREAAAERMARAAAPPGGRFEGLATKVPEAIVQGMGELAAFPGRYAQGQTGYQPGQMASEQPRATQWAPEMATNMLGAPALTGGVPGMGSGIKAWHASPHDFDKVDLSKIGTGQGAQSYGPGFYAAESPAVSGRGGEYWNEFRGRLGPAEMMATELLKDNNFDRAAAIKKAKLLVDNLPPAYRHVNDPAGRVEALRLLESDKHIGPRVYELNLKADPRSFLQWDEPLKNQPDVYKKLDISGGLYPVKNRPGLKPEEATGEQWFRNAAEGRGSSPNPRGWAAMKMLDREGIPGIRYADAASRNPQAAASTAYAVQTAKRRLQFAEDKGAPKWEIDHFRQSVKDAEDRVAREIAATPRTYNYVINNPDIIEIMRKLAIPGAVGAGAMGGLAKQDEYRQ